MTTERDFSVMTVQVDGEPTPIERAVRVKGRGFQGGSFCDGIDGGVRLTIASRRFSLHTALCPSTEASCRTAECSRL